MGIFNYDYYKSARNAAWKTLYKYKVTNFPLNLHALLKNMGIKAIPYSKAKISFARLKLNYDNETNLIKFEGKYYILYDENVYKLRLRFNIAHEIGHLVLKHFKSGVQFFETKKQHKQAQDFAARLLMPLIVIHINDLWAWELIANRFQVSDEAAKYRCTEYHKKRYKNKFNSHPLEHRYYKLYMKEKRV